MDRSRTYTIQVRAASRTNAIRFNSCSDMTASTSMNLTTDRTGVAELSLSGNVHACNSGSADIHAKLTNGGTAATKKSVHVSALPKPSQLRANGDSANGKGATVRWNPVSSDVSYELRYGRECVRTTATALCSDTSSTWANPVAVASGSSGSDRPVRGETVGGIDANDPVARTLSDLSINTIYRVQVRTVRNGAVSDWSGPVFLYTSKDPPAGSVATYSFSSAQTNGHYQYTICKRSFSRSAPSPSDRENVAAAWGADIESGIESWETGVKWKLSSNRNIVRASKSGALNADTGDCAGNAESSAVKGFDSNMDFRDECGWGMSDFEPRATACAFDASGNGNIFIDLSGKFRVWRPGVKTSSGCSDVHRYLSHEAGHVFGLNSHPTITDAIMFIPLSSATCQPTIYDILAVMAMYQSR